VQDGLTLGEYVRRLRRRSKLSLQSLAPLVEVSVSTLSRIENDNLLPTVDQVVRLARALDGDLDRMLELADCLPREILERLTRRSVQAATSLHRASDHNPDPEFAGALVGDVDPALRAAIAEHLDVSADDLEALFGALQHLAAMTREQREVAFDAIALMAKGAEH